MTPHIESKIDDIAKVVIMPGDPKRVVYIANNYLDNPVLVNEVRGELAYTGFYKGKRVTIFSSGMGIPSMGIYSHELFKEYDVDVIIRIGSAGSYSKDLYVNDLFLVSSSYSESNYAKFYSDSSNQDIVFSNSELNDIIKSTSLDLNINIKIGQCHSTEAFYTKDFDINKIRDEKKCDCVEMESYSLFTNANYLGKKATCLLTVSDSFITGERLSSIEREKNFNQMILLALESALKID